MLLLFFYLTYNTFWLYLYRKGSLANYMNKGHRTGKRYIVPEYIFYGNYFYGICAVALTVEATVQQEFPLNGFWYFVVVFCTTVLYYTYPYVRKGSATSTNPRTNWYTRHYHQMLWSQITMTIMLLLLLILFLRDYGQLVFTMTVPQWILLLIFPAVAGLYYGASFLSKNNLRNIGWLKPFVIGFTWAGLVTIYPVLFYSVVHNMEFHPNFIRILLFTKNFMFITLLCIMFDIKDYRADYIRHLRTFVVKMGLRKTIFYIVFPLTLLGLVSFLTYAFTHGFSFMKIILNIIPFLLLILGAYSLRKRRSLLYYLIVIDGLMLVKAICGTLAMLYF